jgi:uncharacterized protein (UPF0333 family)
MKNKTKKGQAALEYLMTYGWAILVIVIVLGILLLLFTNMSKVQRCMTPVGFSCGDSQPIVQTAAGAGTSLSMSMVLQNGLGKSIKIYKAVCFMGAEPSEVPNGIGLDTSGSPVTIQPGNTATFSKATSREIPCYFSTEAGSRATGSANQQFNGVVIYYYLEDPDSLATPDSPRKMTVSVSTSVVQGSG